MIRYAMLITILAVGIQVTARYAWSEPGSAVITEFPTPSAASLPQGIDIAPNGDKWFAETSVGRIAVLRSDGTTSEFASPGSGQPIIVKVAGDGIWFTDGPGRAIGRLNPSTGLIEEFAIPSGSSPLFLQIGADGSKWFSKTTGVGRLSPDGVITEWDILLEHPDDNIEQISLDSGGRLWFVERNFDGAGAAGTNKVRRLDPVSNIIRTYLVPTLGGNPAGVHANANGTVWVSEYFANALALLDPNVAPHTDEVVTPGSSRSHSQYGINRPLKGGPETGIPTDAAPSIHSVSPVFTPGWIEFHIPTANAQAEDIRVDSLGRVWFEEDIGELGVLNPWTSTFIEVTIPSPDSGYFNIALDPTRPALWFTEAGIFAPVATKIGELAFDGE